MHKKPKNLLSIDTNAKTVKGQTLGFLTGILYLAPADQSGHNVCATAELAGCKSACLFTAGRGAMSSVQAARLNRTHFFFEDRAGFMSLLVQDIARLVRRAAKLGMTPLVRLNGTSDIRWETVRAACGRTLFELFPNVQRAAAPKAAPAQLDDGSLADTISEHRTLVSRWQTGLWTSSLSSLLLRDRCLITCI